MTLNLSLKQRIVLSYCCLALLLSSVFSGVLNFAEDYVEERLVYSQLSMLLNHAIDHGEVADSDSLFSSAYAFYTEQKMPAHVRALPLEGKVHELEYAGSEYAVLKRTVNGRQYALQWDQQELEAFEISMFRWWLLAIAIGLLVAAACSWFIVSKTLHPLRQLTEQLRNKKPQARVFTARDDEIGYLAQSLAARDAEIEEHIAREREFTGDASHELRTPLAVILGAAENVAVRVDRDDRDTHAFVDRIVKSTREASELIDGLLLLARGADRISMEPLNLAVLLEEETEKYRPMLAHKPVSCRLKLASVIRTADASLVRMAFGNIIKNAFNYTASGAVIIELKEQGLIVQDTGSGVESAIADSLFERFVKGDRESGEGLGLSIVRRVCDTLGWRVSYHPADSGGSVFSIEF